MAKKIKKKQTKDIEREIIDCVRTIMYGDIEYNEKIYMYYEVLDLVELVAEYDGVEPDLSKNRLVQLISTTNYRAK